MKIGTRKRLNIQSIKCGSEIQLNLSNWDSLISASECAEDPVTKFTSFVRVRD